MGCAPMSYVLWKDFMTVDPKAPKWFNRDRFVLSAGHGSMLNYSLLHLMGFNLSVRTLAGCCCCLSRAAAGSGAYKMSSA